MYTYFSHLGEGLTVTLLWLKMLEKNKKIYYESEKDNTQ